MLAYLLRDENFLKEVFCLKTTKKLLCAILTLIMLLSLFPMAAFADGENENNENAAEEKTYPEVVYSGPVAVGDTINPKIISIKTAADAEPVAATKVEPETISEGENTYTVTYGDDSDTVTLTITGKNVDKIEAVGTVDKAKSGKALIDGFGIAIYYADEETATTYTSGVADFTIEPETLLPGENTYTIKYLGKESNFTAIGYTIPSVSVTITEPVVGSELVTSATVEDALSSIVSASVTWDPADEAAKAGTEYTATIVLTAAEGYEFTDDATVKINDNAVENPTVATSSVTATYSVTTASKTMTYTNPDAVTYNGTAQSFAVTPGDENAVVTYFYGDYAATGTTTAPSYTSGTNTVSFTITCDGYADVSSSFEAIVKPATLNVKANNVSKKFNTADPALTYSYTTSDVKGSDKIGSIITGSLERESGEIVKDGGYAITQGTLAVTEAYKDKYTLSFTQGTLTITSCPGTFMQVGSAYTDTLGTHVTLMDENGNFTYRVYSSASYKVVGDKDTTAGYTVVYNGASNEVVSLTSPVDLSLFKAVYFNGQLLGGEYYSLKSGSTIVTIANSYLNTFPEGKYAVDIVSTDGTTTRGYVQVSGLAAQRSGTSYNSSGTYSPKTGDSSNLALWISILVVCVVAIVIVVIIVGKNKKKNDEPKDKN
jgi:hypothetical protein